MESTFASSISCIDGRIQDVISQWIKENFGVDYVDTITEHGADKRISKDVISKALQEKAAISVNAHKSSLIVFSGHHDCAANPASFEEHVEYIKKGVEIIKSWNLGVRVIGIWVDENWSIVEI